MRVRDQVIDGARKSTKAKANNPRQYPLPHAATTKWEENQPNKALPSLLSWKEKEGDSLFLWDVPPESQLYALGYVLRIIICKISLQSVVVFMLCIEEETWFLLFLHEIDKFH